MKRIIALILFLMLLLTGCSTPIPVPEAPELMEPVQAQPKTTTVKRENLLDATTLTGNIAMEVQGVSFLADGVVETINVIPGQTVTKGEILAVLSTESLQLQLDNLLQQKESTSYSNALTNQNLQIDVDICQLKLKALDTRHAEALKVKTDALAAMEAALSQLQQSNAAAIASLEQQIAGLQAQLDSSATLPEDAALLRGEIAALQSQIDQLQQSADATVSGSDGDIQALKSQIDDLQAQQALERRLYELDLQDAELALKHAKQTQAHAAKQVDAKITVLEEKIANAAITAPIDGTVTWISSSTRVSVDKPFLYISDPNRRYIRTEEYGDYSLKNAETIYALIGDAQYDLTYRPQDVDQKIYLSLNGITPHSFFDFEKDAEIPESANALVFCVHSYRENVLSIPTSALNRNNQGYFVYRQANGQQEQVYIQTGMSTALRVEVVSGLEEGDVVYVAD